MPRYIDANKALEMIDEWLETVGYPTISKGCSYYYELQGCIEDTPTEDVQKVVRCKDCIFNYANQIPGGEGCSQNVERRINDEYFCADGKREEETEMARLPKYVDLYLLIMRIREKFHTLYDNNDAIYADDLKAVLEEMPAADVQPVRHGHWAEIRNQYGEPEGWICECGRRVIFKENHCPDCGAKMDEENER